MILLINMPRTLFFDMGQHQTSEWSWSGWISP